jgi:phosphoribosylaminoimidazole-succinocarboxamide synthase
MDTKEKHGYRLAEGKTKVIWGTPGNELRVLIESKDDITAGDGAKHDILPGKAIAATTTTCNVFRLIQQAGVVPTHYHGQADETTLEAIRASMIPIEVVVRRRAAGSYLKRNPDVKQGEPLPRLEIEFFYKDDDQHDPLMVWKPTTDEFLLYDAKLPVIPGSEIGRLSRKEVDPAPPARIFLRYNEIAFMRMAAASVFELLERTWVKQDMVLVDLKVEFGFDHTGNLMLADVIDNDSWRLWRYGLPDGQLDKQVYRDLGDDDPAGKEAAMAQIRQNYELVAKMTERFGA